MPMELPHRSSFLFLRLRTMGPRLRFWSVCARMGPHWSLLSWTLEPQTGPPTCTTRPPTSLIEQNFRPSALLPSQHVLFFAAILSPSRCVREYDYPR